MFEFFNGLLERGADADAVDGKRGVSARGAAEAPRYPRSP